MKPAGAIDVSSELSESQRAALIALLPDEDPAVYQLIRGKILGCGPGAVQWLRPHLLSRDPVLRRRVQEIVHHFECRAADDRFLGFCLRHGETFDLEEGAWLLAQTQYPDINTEAYRALLDSYAADLRERLLTFPPAQELLKTVNTYLFGDLGFTGNEENYHDPDNSYLNRVLDRRTGNPINLCLVYLLIGKRLKLPVAGIGLPGHFVCRYQSNSAELYIDAFHGGRLLTKADCVQYLLKSNFSVKDDYLSPVSPRRFLLRVCANLHQVYLQSEADEKATRVQRYLVALGR